MNSSAGCAVPVCGYGSSWGAEGYSSLSVLAGAPCPYPAP